MGSNKSGLLGKILTVKYNKENKIQSFREGRHLNFFNFGIMHLDIFVPSVPDASKPDFLCPSILRKEISIVCLED